MSSRKKQPRKTKTNAEIKAAANNYKNKKIKADKEQINGLAKDRLETQQSISDAITGVLALNKVLSDKKVIDLIPEETHAECVKHIQDFKDVVNKTAPVIKNCLKQMEELENHMLKDTSKKDDYWAVYSLQGLTMLDAVNELTSSSLNTTVTCSAKINEVIGSEGENK